MLASRSGRSPPLPFLIVPMLMAVLGYVLMKKLLFDLVDEVWDDGDTLIVKNGNREAQIALTDVINVGYDVLINPPRVTLKLRRACIFGRDVSFCAPVRWLPFSTSPIIDELIHRIDAKRAV